ncbi:aldo-keto reductase, putative [Ricinus communis]|uniref:Aldo-keto reductase, putative n=1 Tax=Ricinus communis TaxID=3988 RepID=B9SVL0_RICCO|nr:aldo-keto reductase, putative [Ricinus communis]|eukprot:XP_002530029.1 non-functional NADPH-dependent codeinone reductase 2 [Ricinus communis]
MSIPEVKLASSSDQRNMPVMALGTAADPFDESAMRAAILDAIRLGYRHFDTAAMYGSENVLGEAIIEALKLGVLGSRNELFITSKLWTSDAHAHLVGTALKKSLRNLQLDYLDLYLVHWPISSKPGIYDYPMPKEELQAMDFKAVWAAMEECQRLGLTKSIGVSNFSCKKLDIILSSATIPPSVNQVELNPVWQQKKLIEFCRRHSIIVTAFSPLGAKGANWGSNLVMDNEILKEVAKAHGKTVAQVALRWIIEQGTTLVVKSYKKERLKENMEIFDWTLSQEAIDKINQIPQQRFMLKEEFVSPDGPFKSIEELWDGEL